jgi:thioredoxin-dependent peroxiredoxin
MRYGHSRPRRSSETVATPVNWKQGDDVIIAGSVSDEQAREKFPGGWKAPKPYLRIVRPAFF